MSNLSVALAQMTPRFGNLQVNLEQHLQQMDEAADADLIIFPELSLTGYYLRDLVSEVACKATADDPIFAPLLAKTADNDQDAVVGFVEEDTRGRFYVSAAYLSRGEVRHVHRKVYLPTYGMFDDGRFFSAGDSVRAFDTPFGRVGVLICEDFWHMSLPYVLWQDGADILIFINCSPGRGVNTDERPRVTQWTERVCRAYAGLFTNYVISVNRAGYEDGIAFAGGSLMVNPDGDLITRGADFENALITQSIDLNQIRRTRARLPLLRDERPDIMTRELNRLMDNHGLNAY